MDSELHYLSYEPEAVWQEMMDIHSASGGDVLYGGDEKEILLRAVQEIVMHVFAGVDNALRMATLRYAQGDYLKLIGEERNCPYNEAIAATGRVAVTLQTDGKPKTIPAGAVMTVDGERYFATTGPIVHTGATQVVAIGIQCTEPGVAGNGVPVGAVMKLVAADAAVREIAVTEETRGGVAAEDLEAYRERVRTSAMRASTTGPSEQYEALAQGASAAIVDVKAANGGPGIVDVNLLLTEGADRESVIAQVLAVLNDVTARPLTDTVNVQLARAVPYEIRIGYTISSPFKVDEGYRALRAAADEYIAWQDGAIARAFDPFRLLALLYQVGASRVEFLAGSQFDGGPLVYTEMDRYSHASGIVLLEVLPT